jgi:dipeptidyl aminopeptidase/acylaminoacyl peptidase
MRFLCFFVAALLSLRAQTAGELVPVEKFAQSSDFSQARLSPDGRYIARLQEINSKQWLVILDLETRKNFRIDPGTTVTGLRKEVSSFRWISDRRISFVTTVFDGQAFTGVSAVDCDGKNWVAFAGPDVNPYEQNPLLANQIIHSFEDEDQSVLMIDRGFGDGRDLVYPDVVKVSTLSRVVRTVVKNPGNVVNWVPDRAGVIRLGVTRDGLKSGVIYRADEASPWRKLPPPKGREAVSPLGFSPDGTRLIVAAANEHKRRAVYYYDIVTGETTEIASHPQFDIIPERGSPSVDGVTLSGVVTSELADDIIGIRYITDGPRTLWVESHFADLQEAVDRIIKGTVNLIVSRSRDEKRFLVLAFSDRNPGTYYLIDLKGEKPVVARLAERHADFPQNAAVPMYPIKYRARDGEQIHGYLSLPLGAGRTNLPLVVMPHGGPFVRDVWGCSPMVQFLANRGYAVLQMNFRGSPGYGIEFLQKGKREVGRAMQDDIEDGTRWAIEQGVADPARVAIVGGSYGGYAAMFALAHNPELYRCGVSINGVTDWSDIIRERRGEEYRYAYQHYREWIGDPKLEFLESVSPVNFAAKITAPLLIAQGKDDRTVPPKQARKMVSAMEKAGRPVQSLYFANEGHNFREEKNRVKLLAEIEKFLAKNLAAKSGP